MAQVTIYLDEETNRRLTEAAKAENLSKSKWISMIIRHTTETQWPDSVVRLAGAWKNFPSLEEIRSSGSEDSPREVI